MQWSNVFVQPFNDADWASLSLSAQLCKRHSAHDLHVYRGEGGLAGRGAESDAGDRFVAGQTFVLQRSIENQPKGSPSIGSGCQSG